MVIFEHNLLVSMFICCITIKSGINDTIIHEQLIIKRHKFIGGKLDLSQLAYVS